MNVDDEQLERWTAAYSVGGADLYVDAREMIAELRRVRAALRAISALDYDPNNGDPELARKQFRAGLMLARLALNLPAHGEHAVIGSNSGPSSDNVNQNPPGRAETGVPGPIYVESGGIPARGASPAQKQNAAESPRAADEGVPDQSAGGVARNGKTI